MTSTFPSSSSVIDQSSPPPFDKGKLVLHLSFPPPGLSRGPWAFHRESQQLMESSFLLLPGGAGGEQQPTRATTKQSTSPPSPSPPSPSPPPSSPLTLPLLPLLNPPIIAPCTRLKCTMRFFFARRLTPGAARVHATSIRAWRNQMAPGAAVEELVLAHSATCAGAFARAHAEAS